MGRDERQASEVAARVREAHGTGADARQDEERLLTQLGPLLRRESERFDGSSGSLSTEDLEQVAALAALRAARVQDLGDDFFAWNLRRVVRRALHDYVGAHGRDVRRSDHARRGRRGEAGARCLVVAFEAAVLRGDSGPTDPALPADEQMERAELRQVVRGALARIRPQSREVLTLAFGLNGDAPVPERRLADRYATSRYGAERMVGAALEELRTAIAGGTGAAALRN